ncbi:hypothetical protein [Pedobacter caeni]|uniref:Lipoprotein n=1 Tax=Pedobacter caeni TaxID=288992 RepID=A0A1M5DJ68_9SPHI|nr:hypothetical protein [Pedobacter caeni]SHF66782.1 hypothetical protein SAMN04488522_103248 [Pedobacter caeni]
MRINKLTALCFLSLLMFTTGCEKNETNRDLVSSKNQSISLKEMSSTGEDRDSGVGGTIGCTIQFVKDKDGEKYEGCIDGALGGTNKIPLASGAYPWWTYSASHFPPKPCPDCLYAHEEYSLMFAFWSYLGAYKPIYDMNGIYLEPWTKLKDRLSGYNQIILDVFGDVNKVVKVPADRNAQRVAIQSYFDQFPEKFDVDDCKQIYMFSPIVTDERPKLGLFPGQVTSPFLEDNKEAIIQYVGFIYNKYFEIRGALGRDIFSGNFNPNDPFFGVKINYDKSIL